MSWLITLVALVLHGFITISADCTDPVVLHGASGGDINLPILYLQLSNDDELEWHHNSKVILKRKSNRFKPGKKEDIGRFGCLQLKALTSAQAGEYRATVFKSNGDLVKEWCFHLLVIDRVSKPKVEFACPPKSTFTFNCIVTMTQTVTFEWRLNNNTLKGEAKQTISLTTEQLKGVKSLTCSAINKVSRETSDSIKPVCEVAGHSLLGLPFWIMVSILAGGGGLLVLLILITIVCCCRSHRRGQKRLDEEEELRLASLTQQPQTGPARQQHRHKCAGGPEYTNPRPIPRAQRTTTAQPRAQDEGWPPQAPRIEEHPPPLPQPRRTDPAPTSTEHRPPLPQARKTRPRKH